MDFLLVYRCSKGNDEKLTEVVLQMLQKCIERNR